MPLVPLCMNLGRFPYVIDIFSGTLSGVDLLSQDFLGNSIAQPKALRLPLLRVIEIIFAEFRHVMPLQNFRKKLWKNLICSVKNSMVSQLDLLLITHQRSCKGVIHRKCCPKKWFLERHLCKMIVADKCFWVPKFLTKKMLRISRDFLGLSSGLVVPRNLPAEFPWIGRTKAANFHNELLQRGQGQHFRVACVLCLVALEACPQRNKKPWVEGVWSGLEDWQLRWPIRANNSRYSRESGFFVRAARLQNGNCTPTNF